MFFPFKYVAVNIQDVKPFGVLSQMLESRYFPSLDFWIFYLTAIAFLSPRLNRSEINECGIQHLHTCREFTTNALHRRIWMRIFSGIIKNISRESKRYQTFTMNDDKRIYALLKKSLKGNIKSTYLLIWSNGKKSFFYYKIAVWRVFSHQLTIH